MTYSGPPGAGAMEQVGTVKRLLKNENARVCIGVVLHSTPRIAPLAQRRGSHGHILQAGAAGYHETSPVGRPCAHSWRHTREPSKAVRRPKTEYDAGIANLVPNMSVVDLFRASVRCAAAAIVSRHRQVQDHAIPGLPPTPLSPPVVPTSRSLVRRNPVCKPLNG